MKINEDMFKTFEGKNVKVIIKDLDKPHLIRGKVVKVENGFILIKGDYSEQIVPFDSILKITHNLEGDQNGTKL